MLVKFRVPHIIFTELTVKAFSANQTINEYLSDLVVNHE